MLINLEIVFYLDDRFVRMKQVEDVKTGVHLKENIVIYQKAKFQK
jgi:hypothetical protein